MAEGETFHCAGVPVAWKLIPAPSPPVYADPSNEHSRRGAFATKQLWVTPHSDDEKYPAGEYPLMAGDSNNIVNWTSLVSESGLFQHLFLQGLLSLKLKHVPWLLVDLPQTFVTFVASSHVKHLCYILVKDI